MALGFDEKKAVCGVVYAFCFPDPNDVRYITLKDYRTGKSLGTYAPDLGLSL
jgi:hypothetical protein